MAIWNDIRTAVSQPSRTWPDIVRAAVELLLARLQLGRDHSPRLLALDVQSSLSVEQLKLVDRVAFTIPRVAARVPWRADCLVQSLAARHWLETHGVPSNIVIGVRPGRPVPLDAHAWLTVVGGRVVVGGDVRDYAPMGR